MYRIPSTLVNLSALLALAGCAQATGPAAGGDGGTEEPDASVGLPVNGGTSTDAATQLPDAAPVGPVGDHLLITEVVLQPTEAEFVEIYNPTDAAVALDDYYLADVPSYYLVPAGLRVVASSDFVVRFPAGASLGGPAGGRGLRRPGRRFHRHLRRRSRLFGRRRHHADARGQRRHRAHADQRRREHHPVPVGWQLGYW